MVQKNGHEVSILNDTFAPICSLGLAPTEGMNLSTLEAELLFIGSLILTATASTVLSRRIEQLGKWLLMSESLLGIVAALGPDAPEISSSLSALRSGNHDLGLGIVVGSNIFNLAALLGLSACAYGKVRVDTRILLLNGGSLLG